MLKKVAKKFSMSHVGKNIKRIRAVRKLSQADFAKLFNLARPSVGAYEEGRSEPKIQTLLDIAQKFSLSVDILLTKELTVNDLYKLDMVNEKFDQVHGGNTTQRQIVKTGAIGFVRSTNFLEYIVNYQNRDFLNSLPPIDLPLSFKGEVRAFEMYGPEMDYSHSGIHHGDILLCKKEDYTDLNSIKAGKIYLLVTKEQVIVRRLKDFDAKRMSMISDDPNYNAIEVMINDGLLEVWKVKGVYSTYLNPPKLLGEKVMRLEKAIEGITERLAKLEAE